MLPAALELLETTVVPSCCDYFFTLRFYLLASFAVLYPFNVVIETSLGSVGPFFSNLVPLVVRFSDYCFDDACFPVLAFSTITSLL